MENLKTNKGKDKKIEDTIQKAVSYTVKKIISEKDKYKPLFEGIDYNTFNNTVKFTDEHEDNVDTSLKNNPSFTTQIVDGVNVWSLFKRKQSPYGYIEKLDGNPVLNALKGIDGWRFVSNSNRKLFIDRLERILDNFVSKYKVGLTVVVPSGGPINGLLASMVQKKAPEARIIDDVMRKLSVDEVWSDLSRLDSPFRKVFGKDKVQWRQTSLEMISAMEKMEKERDGYFTYHLTPRKYRNAITKTLEKNDSTCAKYVSLFNGQNILILDDNISRANTIKNACEIIKDFEPASITVLTMFSKKYPAD